VLTAEGGDALGPWQDLFGVRYTPGQNEGQMAAGMRVTFEGALAAVQPQIILTGFLVDRVYPVAPAEGTATVARVKADVAGTLRTFEDGGSATFLGYRPRDDQSGSLGYETRNWYEVLQALGAYPPTGRFPGYDDNTESVSRNTPYLACRFPNGAVALAPHLRHVEENWPGGFARDAAQDREIVARLALPPRAITLRDFRVNGHTVTYEGVGAVAFRVDGQGRLLAFAGSGATSITVDGQETTFANQASAEVAWAPVPPSRRRDGGAVLQLISRGEGVFRIPAATLPPNLQLVVEGAAPGSRGDPLPSRREHDALVFTITPELAGRWIYGVPGATSRPSAQSL
jgi:hypothetical protein